MLNTGRIMHIPMMIILCNFMTHIVAVNSLCASRDNQAKYKHGEGELDVVQSAIL